MIANKYVISSGVGKADNALPSFDKALLHAGVGNYNLVRLSSILPAGCERVSVWELPERLKEGSLLPTAYSTISSDVLGERIVSAIGVGKPVDKNKVGVIMEYSAKNIDRKEAVVTLSCMIADAFAERGWHLDGIESTCVEAVVEEAGKTVTTFACIAEWQDDGK